MQHPDELQPGQEDAALPVSPESQAAPTELPEVSPMETPEIPEPAPEEFPLRAPEEAPEEAPVSDEVNPAPALEIAAEEPAEHPEAVHIHAEIHAEASEHDDLEPQIAWDEKSREELLAALQEILAAANVEPLKARFIAIRDAFRKAKADEVAARRLKYIENGGDPETFEVLRDETDEQFEAGVKAFFERRADIRRRKEQEQENNLKIKRGIIDELKKLMDQTTNVSGAFDRLHELQTQWRETGMVPPAYADEIWKNYHHHTNNFYEVIKINKELRELDQKKNLELKTLLCEKAEQLLFVDSISASLDEYKTLQEQWKEIGPVAREISETLWERFRSAGDKLFDRRRSYIQEQEASYGANLAAKTAICERADVLVNALPLQTHQHWQEASEKMAVLLEEWKKIGFASRKDNEAIWGRFKDARDKFYDAKENFYKTLRNTQNENYKLKVDLCMEAESLRESTDWKKTGDRLRQLQDQWKNVGPVSKKHSEKLWQRFRKACDTFYENRNKHFEGMNSEQDENLRIKQELVAEIQNFQPGADHNANFEALKAFQAKWISIGHVPLKEKDALNKAYRAAIDAQFNKLKAESAEVRRNAFRSQVQHIQGNADGKDRLHQQKNVVQDKIRRLQTEVQTLENNIGFLANSKSKAAEEMRRDIEKKIAKAKGEIGGLIDQLKILRES